jgi:hypothetical protein
MKGTEADNLRFLDDSRYVKVCRFQCNGRVDSNPELRES